VFDRLIWCVDDNGATIFAVREVWLTSDDRGRVEIALAMDEGFPFKTIDEMNLILSRVAATWPDLAPRCDELRAQRAAIEMRA
jgi:hypothetical protein